MVRKESASKVTQKELLKELYGLVDKSDIFSKNVENGFKKDLGDLNDVVNLDDISKFYHEFSEIFYTLLPRINNDRVEIPNSKLHSDYKDKDKYGKKYFIGRDITYRYNYSSNGVVLKGSDLFNFIGDNDIIPFISGNVISVLERKKKIINDLRTIINKYNKNIIKGDDDYYRSSVEHFIKIKPKILRLLTTDDDNKLSWENHKIEKIRIVDNGNVAFYVKDDNIDKDSYRYRKGQANYRGVLDIEIKEVFDNFRELSGFDFGEVFNVLVLKEFETEIKEGYKELTDVISKNVVHRKALMDELKKKFSARLTIAKI